MYTHYYILTMFCQQVEINTMCIDDEMSVSLIANEFQNKMIPSKTNAENNDEFKNILNSFKISNYIYNLTNIDLKLLNEILLIYPQYIITINELFNNDQQTQYVISNMLLLIEKINIEIHQRQLNIN